MLVFGHWSQHMNNQAVFVPKSRWPTSEKKPSRFFPKSAMQGHHLVFVRRDLQDWFPSSHKLLPPKLVDHFLTEVKEADLIKLKKKKANLLLWDLAAFCPLARKKRSENASCSCGGQFSLTLGYSAALEFVKTKKLFCWCCTKGKMDPRNRSF